MKMNSFLAILVLLGTVSLKVRAQDVRSKVAPPSEKTALTNIIDLDKSVYGTPWEPTKTNSSADLAPLRAISGLAAPKR
jgi:hypothetical protein